MTPSDRLILSVLAATAYLSFFPDVARADPLNPLEFSSAGNTTLVAGTTYTIDTMAGTLAGPLLILSGTYQGNTLVFTFDSLTVQSTATITVTGRKPVALLSRGDLTFGGNISRNGAAGGTDAGTANLTTIGGDGAGSGGGGSVGTGANFNTGGGIGGGAAAAGCGGSFGGRGGAAPTNATYGNLLLVLEGGSGGAGRVDGSATTPASSGGAGGGAIELGALGTLSITDLARITANGGAGGLAPANSGGGGGSGGGILLHASSLQIGNATISARGGTSNFAGGGGGRIVAQSANVPSTNVFDAAGGTSPTNPGLSGSVINRGVSLSATDLDFGDVPVGTSLTRHIVATGGGGANVSANGQFPPAAAPFTRVGTGIFSSLRPGRTTANAYTFTPTTTGVFTQQLTFLSNAGIDVVNITGRGVLPTCLGDLNADGMVNTTDLTVFLARFGTSCL